jgi:hypothetical protein
LAAAFCWISIGDIALMNVRFLAKSGLGVEKVTLSTSGLESSTDFIPPSKKPHAPGR